MERFCQWAWDRYGPHYSWAIFVLTLLLALPVWATVAFILVAFEGSNRFLVAAAVASISTTVLSYLLVQPASEQWRPVNRWAAGEPIDPFDALNATYSYGRGVLVRGVGWYAFGGAVMGIVLGALSGASSARVLELGLLGATAMTAAQLIAIHHFVEAFLRPARAAIAGDSGIGDALPRSRPTFAVWSTIAILATAWIFSLAGASLEVVLGGARSAHPALAVLIASAMTLIYAVPITVGGAFGPSLRPIRDLAEGTERVAAGDYSQRLPAVQDDDLGALAASFNRMQSGLAERERLRAAFGSYVDPALATRLLEQGDDIFTGERRDVSVMFIDVRDFTPFAESHPAEDTVAHLNALFEIVVPAVIDVGGHVNKYLGDGALAVFGAPNPLADHAEAAVAAAIRIQRLVANQFQGDLRIGIGINTGPVIAGTIGGAGKLEFTLIGDTVNVAARVEQLTKTTGDAILITQDTLETLAQPPTGLLDRGFHELKGKSGSVRVHALGSLT